MRPNRQERRELARHLADVVFAMPEAMLPALEVLIAATAPGRAGVILVRGGPLVRFSFVVAGQDRVEETVAMYDRAFAAVPGVSFAEFMSRGADAKSTH